MIEINPFPYYLPSHPKKLILGSFPCYNGKDYGNWFYSGSGKNHFWKLLSDLYGMPVVTLEEKKRLCEKHGIALSDVAYKIRRKKGDCSDANLEILQFNKDGIDHCLKSGIKIICFTSHFVRKHFLAHYPGCKIPGVLLPSPSPAANRHIGGLPEYKKMLLDGEVLSAYDYRLKKYRELLLTK